MCLILFAHKAHPNYKLVVAANRDEFYKRETQKADYWEDEPNILAGRDTQAGGTWMGVNKSGEVSLLTNYRDLKNIKVDAPSRGHLVSDFLKNNEAPLEYLQQVEQVGKNYNGFNLICGNSDSLYYYGNYQEGVTKIEGGVHGLSNALLNTSWPKVDKGVNKLKDVLKSGIIQPEKLFDLLYDDIKAPVGELPDTGVGLDMERMLSPLFIKSPEYGSRCSTVLLIDNNDNVSFTERTYNTNTYEFEDREFTFKIG